MISRRKFILTGAALAAGGIIANSFRLSSLSKHFPSIPIVNANSDGTSDLFCVSGFPGYVNDHHIGLERLLTLMGSNGLRLLKSQDNGAINGPDGLIASDDVVLIKINCQWDQRGGTNTDLVKSLIQTIADHPDGFTGEIVVVDSGQGRGSFTWEYANAEDNSQCIQDVVDSFNNERISTFLWDNIRSNRVNEYDEGDMNDGYILEDIAEPKTGMRFNYPKFRTSHGTYISLKKGIWDPSSGSYSNDGFKLINFPVLKTHGGAGVTACIKHYMGVVSQTMIDNHPYIYNGGMALEMANTSYPILNILDAIYVNPNPKESEEAGPQTPYYRALKINRIAASIDPVALDYWSSKNILMPAARGFGYSSISSMDPDSPNQLFHNTLVNSKNRLSEIGFQATMDPSKINVYIDKAPNFIGMLTFDDYRNRMGGITAMEPSTTFFFPHFHRDSSWCTFYTIVNPQSSSASIDLTYYGFDGSTILTESFSLGPGQKRGTFSPTGSGWMKVESDVPIIGMLNFHDYANRMGSVPGVTPTSTIYFPHFNRNSSWFTFYTIVNPQTSEASVHITHYASDGSTLSTESLTLEAGHKIGRFPDSGNGWIKVESDVPIVGLLNFHDYKNRMGSVPGVTPLSTLYFPHFDRSSSFCTFYTIANPQTSDASVDITQYASDGSIISTDSFTLKPNHKRGTYSATGNGWIKVESDVPIVGLLNFHDYKNRMGSIPGIMPSSTLYFPHFDQCSKWQTFYAIVNVGHDCALASTYYAGDGSTITSTLTSLPVKNKKGQFSSSGNGWIEISP